MNYQNPLSNTKIPIVFDRRHVRLRKERAAHFLRKKESSFLFLWAQNNLLDRLSVIRRSFPLALQLGARVSAPEKIPLTIKKIITADTTSHLPVDIVCDEEFFPFSSETFDLIYSPLHLHTANDLTGALIQMRKSLKPDGLLSIALFGGTTLRDLRSCLLEAELELTGGASARIAPFVEKSDMASLMQRAGFTLPVIDSETLCVTYKNFFDLMHDLRAMGETNTLTVRSKIPPSRKIFARASEIYLERFAEKDGRIPVQFEIIFAMGWAPHESQQNPSPPGSARISLAEFLESGRVSL